MELKAVFDEDESKILKSIFQSEKLDDKGQSELLRKVVLLWAHKKQTEAAKILKTKLEERKTPQVAKGPEYP